MQINWGKTNKKQILDCGNIRIAPASGTTYRFYRSWGKKDLVSFLLRR